MTKPLIRRRGLLVFDLNIPYRNALTGIHRAYIFMRFGAHGVHIGYFEETRLPGNTQIMVVPEPVPEEVLSEYVAQFKAWTIGNGLRELVETFCLFLDEIYEIGVALVSTPASGKQIRTFKGASLREKVQRLRDEFQIEGVFARHFESFTQARNALAHGMGIVRERDCTVGDELIITWIGVESYFTADDGQRYRFGDHPKGVEAKEPLEIVRPQREKRWKVGERIELSPIDMAEICFMANYEAVDVTDALCDFSKKRGIVLKQVEIIRGGP